MRSHSALGGALVWAAVCPVTALDIPKTASPVADLGHVSYQGYHDDTHDLNVWKSIRYAEPPVGKLRWQSPKAPSRGGGEGEDVVPALDQPPVCPQSGAFGIPSEFGFNSGGGDEDCLFLNIYAAPNATALPVLVWIHGGGYGNFGATSDPGRWMNANDNGFITVEVQYRLGAFGFLASPEIKEYGQLNAGLLDQRFALRWVQKHISRFGGDPDRVTIAGQSAGAGSVMFHALAHGGRDESLFNNIIAASPYVPATYDYHDAVPVSNFEAFAELSGCGAQTTEGSSVFECLVAADSGLLKNASGIVSETRGHWGSWAFVPVVDGDFIANRPSAQLAKGNVSGKRLLVGNNANEGVPLTDPNVTTRVQYEDFVSTTFPRFTGWDRAMLNAIYKIKESEPDDDGIRFDTLGDSGPTALTQSGFATGIQQTVFNMAGETTFSCPAQWLAEAFTSANRRVWRYQYSVNPSMHGSDSTAYLVTNETVAPDPGFRGAFQKIWGNFIVNDSPVISVRDASAGYDNATIPTVGGKTIHWPEYSLDEPLQMDLNATGGQTSMTNVTDDFGYIIRTGPGAVNQFRLVNASSWEGGRGERCVFWRDVADRVPQ